MTTVFTLKFLLVLIDLFNEFKLSQALYHSKTLYSKSARNKRNLFFPQIVIGYTYFFFYGNFQYLIETIFQ